MNEERNQQLIRRLKIRNQPKFFDVLWNNLKCVLCREEYCEVRYYPRRMKEEYHNGERFVTHCKKEQHNWW